MRVLCTVRLEVIVCEVDNFAIAVIFILPHWLVHKLALIPSHIITDDGNDYDNRLS